MRHFIGGFCFAFWINGMALAQNSGPLYDWGWREWVSCLFVSILGGAAVWGLWP